MALPATIYRLKIDLSDVDRGVYVPLDLRLARHPSESMRHLLARVLAYCLCYEEGIAFSKEGLGDADEPAIAVRDLQNTLRAWIDVGTPSADRLHRATKAAERVVVFTQHDPALLAREARSRAIHRVEAIEVYALDGAFLDELDRATDRNTRWDLVRTGGQLYVTVGALTATTELVRHALGQE